MPAQATRNLTAEQACERAGMMIADRPPRLQLDTPREEFSKAATEYNFTWFPESMRGQDDKTIDCHAIAEYRASLADDDLVIRNAPSLELSGQFSGFDWITIQPHDSPWRLGPRLPIPDNYSADRHPGWGNRDMSGSLCRLLRHDKRHANGIDEFLDRRVNLWDHDKTVADLDHNGARSLRSILG